mmetsp:Transcript_10439/g.19179  ORF Transcript_10439/g.19179 Transcript_10439/m.19179 type:complete len:80 (-) Transcript_10439:969-1208(-)
MLIINWLKLPRDPIQQKLGFHDGAPTILLQARRSASSFNVTRKQGCCDRIRERKNYRTNDWQGFEKAHLHLKDWWYVSV